MIFAPSSATPSKVPNARPSCVSMTLGFLVQLSLTSTRAVSATWPEAVRRLASTFQINPVRVTVGSDDLTANSRVEQSVEVFDDSRSKE